MHNPYDLHSWSTHYREERLREARVQHLAKQLREHLKPRVVQRVGPTWRNMLNPLLLRGSLAMLALVAVLFVAAGCTGSVSPSVGADTGTASPSATASAGSDAWSSTSSSASASSSAETDTSSFAGMRNTVGMSPSTSIECYTFYSDGTVELRHNGASAPVDSGSYQGDSTFREIVWDSGRATATVVAEGDGLIINDLEVDPIDSCLVPTSG